MSIRSTCPSPRLAGLGVGALFALLVAPAIAAAQQQLSPIQVEAARAETANARADALEEHARTMYSTPSKFREVARLHQRAAMIRGSDPRAAASFRSAAWAYSAAGSEGLATQMMVKAGEHAAMSGRIEEAANFYVDAALLAVADNRQDKVPTILSRVHTVLSAPLFPEEQRSRILRRIGEDTRVAHLDAERRVEQ